MNHINHDTSFELLQHYPQKRRLTQVERQNYIGKGVLQLKAQKADLKRVILAETEKKPTTQDLINQTAKSVSLYTSPSPRD